MTARECLAACVIMFVLGGIGGWSARALTADHRYIRAAFERYEAEARFWSAQANDIITTNEIERGKRNGKKTH